MVCSALTKTINGTNGLKKTLRQLFHGEVNLQFWGGCFCSFIFTFFQMYLFILATLLQLRSSPSARDCRETSSSRKWKDSIYLHNGSLNTCHVVMLLDLFTGRRHSMFGQKISTGENAGLWVQVSCKIEHICLSKLNQWDIKNNHTLGEKYVLLFHLALAQHP